MIDCALILDGEPLNTTLDQSDMATTVLDDLQVTWGRDSVLDQPTAATCRTKLALPPASAAATLDQITPGRHLLVRATYETPITDTIAIANAARATATGATKTGTNTPSFTATNPAATPIIATTPPGPLDTTGNNPAAWDALPRATIGGRYSLTTTITLPPNTTATLHAVYYSGPWASAANVGPALTARTTSGTLTATVFIDPSEAGQWVGIAVRISPIGPSWYQSSTSWTAHTVPWDTYRQVTITAQKVTRLDAGLHIATVFEGRISDAIASWDPRLARPVLALTATDITSDLANRRISSEPWPEQTATTRLGTIAALAGQIRATIDTLPASLRLAPQDVDSQPAQTLLQRVAASTGTVLWAATHETTGPYLRLEDPGARKALYKLTIPATGAARLETISAGSVRIPASVLARTGAELRRDTTDLATVASIQWAEVTKDTEGQQTRTDHTVTVNDQIMIDTYGYRTISISTDLISETSAHQLAIRTFALASPTGWTMPAVTWDTDLPGSNPLEVIAALDATRRIGMPVILDNVASWVPGAPAMPVYLDGGTYTYRKQHWTLDLSLTKAAYPAASIQWKQSPTTFTWARATALTWNDISTATQ